MTSANRSSSKRCFALELADFIQRSKPLATGWIGFYWGQTMEELDSEKKTIAESMTLDWLKYFKSMRVE